MEEKLLLGHCPNCGAAVERQLCSQRNYVIYQHSSDVLILSLYQLQQHDLSWMEQQVVSWMRVLHPISRVK